MMGAPEHRAWVREHRQNKIVRRLRWRFNAMLFAVGAWAFSCGVIVAEQA